MTSTGNEPVYKNTSFRAESSLVERAREIFDASGISVSAAITLFLEACVREGRIPDAVMNPGSSSPESEYVNAVLRSVTSQLHLPDFGNPLIPADVFANEIELEFTQDILSGNLWPWFDKFDAVLSLSSLDSQFAGDSDDEEECLFTEDDILDDFMPEKLPYDYALHIVEAHTKAWAKAEQEAFTEASDPYDVIMGKILRRSRLTLDELMGRLVEAGAVDDKSGDNLNRSLGKMVEDLVAFLKEHGCWDAPEPMCGVPFKEVKKGLIDEAIDGDVAFRADCDCSRFLAHEHPLDLLFEDIDYTMNSAIESPYTSLFYAEEPDVPDSFDYLAELDETLMSLFDSCEFKFPPKTVYDECAKRYLEAMEAAEPGTVAAKCLPYAKAPYDYEKALLYPIAIDMDAEVWAEVYNREAFFTTVQAVRDGVLPDLSTSSKH